MVNLNGFVNLARLNLTSNFIASLILPLWARSNLTVKTEHKFEVRVKRCFANGFKFDEAAAAKFTR